MAMIVHVLRRPDGEEFANTYLAPGNWPIVREWIDEMVAEDAGLPRFSAVMLDQEDENGMRVVRARGQIVAVYHSRRVDTAGLLAVSAAAYRGLPI